jgi:hypothetical protein
MKVLVLNHDKVKCGTYQFCKRVYDLAARSEKVTYIYKEISYGNPDTYPESRRKYFELLEEIQPDFEVVNYHWDRMPWLEGKAIRSNKKIKHYFIWHDGSMISAYDKYLFFGGLDPTGTAVSMDYRVLLPRPLFDYNKEYFQNDRFTIGSFGFPFLNKRLPELVSLINKEFNNAVINLHIPNPYFGDTPGNVLEEIIETIRARNYKPGIELNINTDFVDDATLLDFLAGNDINVFYYTTYPQTGLSSATDYALSVKRPIGITNHMAFRHIVSNEILLDKNTITSIHSRGTAPLQKFYDRWSTSNFTLEMEKLFI